MFTLWILTKNLKISQKSSCKRVQMDCKCENTKFISRFQAISSYSLQFFFCGEKCCTAIYT
ncbi:hypothetical protein HanIR_Chr12g0570081 [Helianthus annuus]|nr:hypothetical protein HanIR_Chr12g0570081 [Helianthus annuus]